MSKGISDTSGFQPCIPERSPVVDWFQNKEQNISRCPLIKSPPAQLLWIEHGTPARGQGTERRGYISIPVGTATHSRRPSKLVEWNSFVPQYYELHMNRGYCKLSDSCILGPKGKVILPQWSNKNQTDLLILKKWKTYRTQWFLDIGQQRTQGYFISMQINRKI